ncbi:NIPSNAP family protein (fragment) [Burkholderiales bacterium 8X]
MLFEMRTYQLPPARLSDYLAIYAAKGKALQCEVLGKLVACFTTEVGALDQVIFIWSFTSFEERSRRRAALAAMPAWQAYVAEVGPLFVRQESRLMRHAPFMGAT